MQICCNLIKQLNHTSGEKKQKQFLSTVKEPSVKLAQWRLKMLEKKESEMPEMPEVSQNLCPREPDFRH